MDIERTGNDPLNSNIEDTNNENTDSDEPLFDEDNHGDDQLPNKAVIGNSSDDDLFVLVTDPAKQVHSMETYITYKVTTKTTRTLFDSSQYEVQRRYQDFVWLREKLEEEFPTFIIAPLPAKFVVKGMLDRFSSEFTERRCIALNSFLQRLSKHPLISFSDHLKKFLTSENFAATGKQGLLARMSGSLKWSNVANPEFDGISEAATLLGEKFGVVDRINERILSEKRELVNEMKEILPTFSEWGEIEEEPIKAVFKAVKESIEFCTEEMDKNIMTSEKVIIPSIKEYILYADNIKQVLKRRNNFQYRFEKVDDELKVKKDEKENLSKSDQTRSFMGRTPEQREEKLTQQIKELADQREKFNDELAKANSNFQADYDRWKQQKLKDNANMLTTFASSQVSYHDNCFGAWEKVLPILQSSSKVKKAMSS